MDLRGKIVLFGIAAILIASGCSKKKPLANNAFWSEETFRLFASFSTTNLNADEIRELVLPMQASASEQDIVAGCYNESRGSFLACVSNRLGAERFKVFLEVSTPGFWVATKLTNKYSLTNDAPRKLAALWRSYEERHRLDPLRANEEFGDLQQRFLELFPNVPKTESVPLYQILFARNATDLTLPKEQATVPEEGGTPRRKVVK